MLRLKKADSPRIKLQKHNNQDTRVTVENQCSQGKKGKSEKWEIVRRVLENFLIRQILDYVWEHGKDHLVHGYEKVIELLEALS